MAEPISLTLAGGGVWWPEHGYLWADKGQAKLPSTRDRDTALTMLQRYNSGEFYCSMCATWYPDPPTMRRFAGQYCDECTPIYKQTHSRICTLCRRPEWDCYC